ncbi:hypothetical protein D3C72_1882260 [compost metagenome]
MAQRKQAGEAGQQHQPQAHHGVDQHKGELRQPVLLDHPGRGQQEQAQQAVPEHVPAVFGELDVLVVVGLENKPHRIPPASPAALPPRGGATSGPAKPVPRWPRFGCGRSLLFGFVILFF